MKVKIVYDETVTKTTEVEVSEGELEDWLGGQEVNSENVQEFLEAGTVREDLAWDRNLATPDGDLVERDITRVELPSWWGR